MLQKTTNRKDGYYGFPQVRQRSRKTVALVVTLDMYVWFTSDAADVAFEAQKL